ncbi:hypothetical protein [Cohnella terricola]|uniref:Uncharacterized protein n=1 Tax=Cohnella terricola TaxID=1289167 RepID=A0A559JKX7_9BACL|nr:hypothetical protein [Cohnella terricola]TVY00533.1 hypothetical protein FPZ45_10930 [Cohnella terricola]
MEELLSFLSRNFYIVFIIIGLLYSMFFRKSPIEKRPPNRMPDFGGEGQQRHPERPERPRMGHAPEVSWPGSEEVESPEPERPIAVKVRVQSKPEPKKAATPVAAQSSLAAPATLEQPQGSSEASLNLTAVDMRRAVIWSEILGPPRAKRPYRR